MKRILGVLLVLITSVTPVVAAEEILVTDFSKSFSDWRIKAFKGKANFAVPQNPRPLVTLTTSGSNFLLAKEFRSFQMKDHPYINFEWMVEKLPEGGDLRNRKTDDQAAGVYVTLPSFPEFINFKSIGYVWDTTALPGMYSSQGVGNIKYVVLRSGSKDELGKWVSEKRNYVEDFQKLWGVKPGKRKVVISIAADSDNTHTSSVASFGKITFSQN